MGDEEQYARGGINRRKGSEWMVVNVEIFMEPWRNIDLLADKRSHERLFLARR
jgi:hypothetical protein